MTIVAPSLAIVIPTCDRHLELRQCLSEVQAQVNIERAAGVNVDVVVTDDGRTFADDIVSSFACARWVPGPRRGPSANRNAGARITKGSWLVFIDDDVLPGPLWLRSYLDAIAADAADVLEGSVMADRPRRAFNETSPINLTGGALWSCNFAIRRSTFDGIGGFDELYPSPGWEDIDLRIRLTKDAAHMIFLPEATVCHPWRTVSLREDISRFRNMEIFLDLHPEESALHYARLFARGVGFHIKMLGRDLIEYRMRGVDHQLGHIIVVGMISVRLWLRAWRFRRRGDRYTI